MEVVSTPKKRARMETSAAYSRIITRSEEKSSDGSRSSHRSKTSAAQLSIAAYVVEQYSEEAKKTLEATPQSPEAESRP